MLCRFPLFFFEKRERKGGGHTERFISTDLNLPIRPSWDLNDEIDDAVVGWIGVQGNVVPEGNWISILF